MNGRPWLTDEQRTKCMLLEISIDKWRAEINGPDTFIVTRYVGTDLYEALRPDKKYIGPDAFIGTFAYFQTVDEIFEVIGKEKENGYIWM